jgi:hypothetical protein
VLSGSPGEATAYFTFAAQPSVAGGIVNGALSLATDPVGEFSAHLQRTPAENFDLPDSFTSGEYIATFRRTSMVVGIAVNPGSGEAMETLLGANVFRRD